MRKKQKYKNNLWVLEPGFFSVLISQEKKPGPELNGREGASQRNPKMVIAHPKSSKISKSAYKTWTNRACNKNNLTRSVQPSHTGKDLTPCMKQTTTNSEKKMRQRVVGGKERIWFNQNELLTIS